MAEKGKQYKGQVHAPSVTPQEVAEAQAEAVKYDGSSDVVSIDVWFTLRGHRDPVMQAAMKATTTVRKASPSDFDTIFKDF